jgi:DNA replication initiation complex subunit (GINS family)
MATERMTQKELDMLRSLQAKQKRVQRAEEEFFREADSRRDELLERWEKSDRLQEAADLIGTDADTLYGWITSDDQIAFFRRKHLVETAPSEDPHGGFSEQQS